jgi:hypothetical protein
MEVSEYSDRYFEICNPLLRKQGKDFLHMLLAFLGEPWDDSCFQHLEGSSFEDSWSNVLSSEMVAAIEEEIGAEMVAFAFDLVTKTSDSE